jgi:transposase
VAHRLQALWQLREGQSVRSTARVLGVGERALQRWVAWYRAGGLAGVRAPRRAGKGRPARLTAAQREALCAHIASGAVHTAQDAVAWVTLEFAVTYRRTGMYSLLGRLGGRPKVPRPANPKSSVAVQEAWKTGGSSRR